MSDSPAVIILAGGSGTRMNSRLPKVLNAVCGRPMIGHVLAAVEALAPGRVIVVTAPDHDAVRAAIAPVESCVQEAPLGTGDAVRVALDALDPCGVPIIVAYGDMPLVTPDDLGGALRALPDGGPGLAVLGFEMAEENAYGRLVGDGEGGLAQIVEAADADADERGITLCNSGIMAASDAGLLKDLVGRLTNENAKNEYYLTDVVALARAEGVPCAIARAEAQGLVGVNTRAELAAAEATMQGRLRAAAMEGGATLVDPATVYLSFDTRLGRDVVIGPHVWFGPGVSIADGAEVRPYCHIEGASVAENAVVGPFARLRPGAEIGADAHIGNFVEIKAARVEKGAKINHLAYVGDARVGAAANIGAGAVTCNYDGFDKHPTEIGAGAFVGSNAALVAPVVIGDGAVIGAGSVITGDVPKDSLAVERGEQKVVAGGGAKYRAKKTGASRGKASGGEG